MDRLDTFLPQVGGLTFFSSIGRKSSVLERTVSHEVRIKGGIRHAGSLAFISLVMLLTAVALAAADQVEWQPVSAEDLALKDNPAAPGSSAMILFKEDFRDDRKGERKLYYRIKLFNEKGVAHADIEIPYRRGSEEVKDIAARTIQPDGKIIDFRGVFFKKTLARRRKFRLLAKTFTLPQVQPGCIIEYRYKLVKKKGETFGSTWIVQEPLFVREARLTLRTGRGFITSLARWIPSGSELRVGDDDMGRVTLRDLPAFEREVFMPPEASIQMRYHLRYSPRFSLSFYVPFVNGFIGEPKKLRAIVQQLVSPQDEPETKLRKLYAAVQERIRNLSFEEGYTKKERKREKLKERKSAKDVWQYGYGFAWEITRLFAGLCRAAGFASDVVLIVQRDTNFFYSDIPLFEQADWQVVEVDLPDGSRYFDPGTRFLPFGVLSWENQGVQGIRIRKKRTELVTTPLSPADENLREDRLSLLLRTDTSAQITMIRRYTGQAAVERRREFFEFSDQQREHELEEELQVLLPAATVKEITWKGFDDLGEAVEITYTFDLPDCAVVLGSRLLVKPVLFARPSIFRSWKREHPVYFPYPYTYIEEVRIVPPERFEVEHLSEPRQLVAAFGQYEASVAKEGDAALYRKKVTVKGLVFEQRNYSSVKQFFDFVAAGDQLHLMLRAPGAQAGSE